MIRRTTFPLAGGGTPVSGTRQHRLVSRSLRICLIVAFLSVWQAFDTARALVQPDISAISDFRTFTGNWRNPDGSHTPRNGNWNMAFQELEIVVAGYLNPFAKALVTVSTPGDGLEIEEAYGTVFKGLPLRTELRAGKYLVDFGRLNLNHVHAFPFLDRPLAHRVLLGPDGFKDQGVNLSVLLPVHVYSKLSFNVLKGDIFVGEDVPDDSLEGRNTEAPIYSGRWNVFLPVGEKGNLDIGVSALRGRYKGKGAYGTGDSTGGFRNLYASMAALDAKYKIKWDDYTSLILQGELIANRRGVFSGAFDNVSNFGGFAFFDYRFRKRYNVGAMIDRAPGIYDNTEDDYEQNVAEEFSNTGNAAFDEDNFTTAYTAFAGFTLLEETTLFRLMARYATCHISNPANLVDPLMTSKRGEFLIALQMIWSLGPHKPHEF